MRDISQLKFRHDAENNQFIVSKVFLKKSMMPTTIEAELVRYWNANFLGCKVVTKSVSPKKQLHKHLTEPFMLRYVEKLPEKGLFLEDRDELRRLHLVLNEITPDMDKDVRKPLQAENRNARMKYFSQLKKQFVRMFPKYQDSALYLECVRANSGENNVTNNEPASKPSSTPFEPPTANKPSVASNILLPDGYSHTTKAA